MDLILVFSILFLMVTCILIYFILGRTSRLSLLASLSPISRVVTIPKTDDLDIPTFLRDRIDGKPLIGYSGQVEMPNRVYENDSRNIKITLKPKFSKGDILSSPFHVTQSDTSKEITIQFKENGDLNQFLECEIRAAGISVEGDRIQRQNLDSISLDYLWNCFFPNSGKHTIAILFRVINQNDLIQIGIVEHIISVNRLDHLTKRQVWLLTIISGFITGGLALIETLSRLGIW